MYVISTLYRIKTRTSCVPTKLGRKIYPYSLKTDSYTGVSSDSKVDEYKTCTRSCFVYVIDIFFHPSPRSLTPTSDPPPTPHARGSTVLTINLDVDTVTTTITATTTTAATTTTSSTTTTTTTKTKNTNYYYYKSTNKDIVNR